MRKKIFAAAGIALLSMAMTVAAQFILGGTADGPSFGSILLLILVLLAGASGILALFASLFAKRDRIAYTWKRLAKLVLLFAGIGLVLSTLLGFIAMLLGRGSGGG